MTPPLRIGYEGKRVVTNRTGLGNYARNLLNALVQYYPDDNYRVYVPRVPQLPVAGLDQSIKLIGPAGKLPGALWRQCGLGRQAHDDGCRVFHGLSNELPLDVARRRPHVLEVPMASVVTIHDLIFRRHPRGYKAIDRAIYDYKFKSAARRATRIIACSRRTRDDIVEFYSVEPSKIDVVYQGCDPQFFAQDSPFKAQGPSQSPYIIAVGTVEPRKNQLLAVKALRGLPDDVRLKIVGRRTAYAKEIDAYASAHGLGSRIDWVYGVPWTQMPSLYANALFATYTSRYEGFGIPVVEALASGVPVISCTGSCLEEAGGEGALYVGPDDEDAAVEAFRQLYEDASLRTTLVEKGREHIASFTPENLARQTMETYWHADSMLW